MKCFLVQATLIQLVLAPKIHEKTYIQQQFDYLLKNKPIIYALNGILRDDENEMRVFKFFENISLLKI